MSHLWRNTDTVEDSANLIVTLKRVPDPLFSSASINQTSEVHLQRFQSETLKIAEWKPETVSGDSKRTPGFQDAREFLQGDPIIRDMRHDEEADDEIKSFGCER